MILFLSELQKEHLNFIHQHSTPVLVDFCKLTIDYLNNGIDSKKYSIASDKLKTSIAVVQNLIHALAYLILEGCKYNLSETNFKSSLAIAGFSSEHQQVLLKLFNTKRTELSRALYLLQQKDPTYLDFRWRFEVQVSSRRYTEEIKPMVILNFVVSIPKDFKQRDDLQNYDKEIKKKSTSIISIDTSIQEAKAASQCQNIIHNILLQCDIPNLMHLTNKLEEALKESKSQHVRKVQRAL